MNGIYIILIYSVIIISCTNGNKKSQGPKIDHYESYKEDYIDEEEVEEFVEEEEDDGFNGEYCANVTYYNSNTGKESDYTLTIVVNQNELERINFPQGWLDDDNYGFVELDENGYTSFTSNKGYDYTLQIIGEAQGCFDNVPRAYQCIGTTKDGDQCEHLTDNPSGYCWQHEDQGF